MTLETPVSVLSINAHGVVFWRYKNDVHIRMDEAQQEADALHTLVAPYAAVFTLVDIRGVRSIDRHSRQLFASEEFAQTHKIQSMAWVADSPLSKFIGNFWKSVNQPSSETQIFDSEESAMTWIQFKLETHERVGGGV